MKKAQKTTKTAKTTKRNPATGKKKIAKSKQSRNPKWIEEIEEMGHSDFSPLAGTVAPLPEVKPEFYINELFNWLTARSGDHRMFYPHQPADYIKESEEYPPRVPEYVLEGETPTEEDFPYEFSEPITSFENSSFQYVTGFHFLKGILTSVDAYPKLLIDRWATHLQIATYSDNLGLPIELRCIDDIINKLNAKLVTAQNLIPLLYHNRHHGRLMSFDCRSAEMDSKTGDHFFEFGFGLVSARKFRSDLIHLLSSRKNLLLSLQSTDEVKPIVQEPAPAVDSKIPHFGYLNQKENAPDITRLGAAQLLFLLQENQMIYRNISKTSLAHLIHYLTGLDAEKVRQQLSAPEFQPKAKLSPKEADYLLKKLKAIIATVEVRRSAK